MAVGRLETLKDSSYVRTDPLLASRIGQNILHLPKEPFSVLDPSSGTGSLFYACADTPWAHKFGIEISAERAEESRQEWPNATIVTAAFEAVNVQGKVGLLLINPPYFQQNGKRAALRFVTDAGEYLQPGGTNVTILTARSDWDGYMVNHWLKWYDRIRIWKFPDRTHEDQEGAFDDYKQIVVVGVRRATPTIPTSEEKKRLLAYQWRDPEKFQRAIAWRGEVAPPDIPETPIDDLYPVPVCHEVPILVVRNADEATLLYALDKAGAHFSPVWQKVTTWPESGYLGSPAMPYTGEAHVAAEIMIGGLDGQIVYGPTDESAEPHLFTAFVGQDWYKRVVEDEVKEKLAEQGCIRVEMRELNDKPILGVLNLLRGTTQYYQGEEVFKFLQPWLQTLANRVVEMRKPLYRLDPADWEIQVTSQFGLDKQLPNADFPGLAVPQLHRVFAMSRSLDVRGRTAIQGEPGTGKTRMATASAARQAYRWRQRNAQFEHSIQPAWVTGLRRAWLKNPHTLAILGLEPVYGWRFNASSQPGKPERKAEMLEKSPKPRIVAYRELSTGRLIDPSDAGPRALPVLITTPLKVVKEYGKEIMAAYPQAEVVHIESYRDIEDWFKQCATSSSPVVFGIISHSTKQAFGRKWKPVVHEKGHVRHVPEMKPDDRLKPKLEPLYDERKRILGYRVRATGQLLTREIKTTYFYCPDCGGRIDATPGQSQEKEGKQSEAKKGGKAEATRAEPVGSRTYFVTKQRWCQCEDSRRTQDRKERGKRSLLSPLWQDDRTEATNRKQPQCSFAEWSAAWTALRQQAERMYAGAKIPELIERVRRDDSLLARLVEVTIRDPQMTASVAQLVERVDPEMHGLRTSLTHAIERLEAQLLEIALHDDAWIQSVVDQAADNEALQMSILSIASHHEPAVREQLAELIDAREKHQAELFTLIIGATRLDASQLPIVVHAVLNNQATTDEVLVAFRTEWPHLEEHLEMLRQHGCNRALGRIIAFAAKQSEAVLSTAMNAAMRDQETRTHLLEWAQEKSEEVKQLIIELSLDQEGLLGLIAAVAQTYPEAAREILSAMHFHVAKFASCLVSLSQHDMRSLVTLLPGVSSCEVTIRELATTIGEGERQIAEHFTLAARRDSSNMVLGRLIEVTKTQVNWQTTFFRLAVERAHLQSQSAPVKAKRTVPTQGRIAARTRLTIVEEGPIAREEHDSGASDGYHEVRDNLTGEIVAYQMGTGGRRLLPITSPHSGRVTGFIDAAKGSPVMRKVSYDFRTPPLDSFSPYDYLFRFFKGCIALSVVDESHNGRSKDADISQAFRQAMRASQTRELTSGTHYGGDIISFYHYWFSFDPAFWIRLGFGWNDAEQALQLYGVVQQWTKEYESDARKGSGHTDIHVSTVPAPGLSAKLIPGLLEDLTYLTVLDVGAHMPPKKEIPKGLTMRDEVLDEKVREAETACVEKSKALGAATSAVREAQKLEESAEKQVQVATLQGQALIAEEALALTQKRLKEARDWAKDRDLADAYNSIVGHLEKLARDGNEAARLAKGTIPRWFAALPCDSPYEVYSTKRDEWGNKGERKLVIRTPVLAWDHLYPMERWLIETVKAELAENRTVMIYIEQITRSMAKRLEWVLGQGGISSWTLPHNTEAEERQQVILDALNLGNHNVVIVPYRLVNEGLNLHNLPDRRGVKTIIWYEQSMNLFMYLQASQRAWRLGADDEVRIYLPFYMGTAAHSKMRKLGGQSGAAAAFAGEPAKGELIKHMGADQTTLARLSASLEEEDIWNAIVPDMSSASDDLATIEANFARRNEELVQALKEGRQWLGAKDTLPSRVATVMALRYPDIWKLVPSLIYLPDEGIFVVGQETEVSETVEVALLEAPARREEKETLPAQEVETPALVSDQAPVIAKVAAQLVFGDEDDIRSARKQHGKRPRRTLPRLKNPTTVKDIPAEQLIPANTPRQSKATQPEIVVVSWWEMSPDEGANGQA